jgi:putative oxidoreductase
MSTEAGIIFLLGRVAFTALFLLSARGHFMNNAAMAGYARSVHLPMPAIAGWPAGLWLLVASLMIIFGVWGDIGCLAIGVFVLVAGAYFHRYWEMPEERQQEQRSSLFRNITLAGAAFALFALWAEAGEAFKYTITDQLIDLS